MACSRISRSIIEYILQTSVRLVRTRCIRRCIRPLYHGLFSYTKDLNEANIDSVGAAGVLYLGNLDSALQIL